MFTNSSGHCKNIWIKNYIFSRKIYLFCENFICSRTNFKFFFGRISLTLFIKSHNNNCCPKIFYHCCLFYKFFLAFFKTNRINNSLSLNTFKSCFNYRPLGGINHKRNSCNIWFNRNKI